MKSLMKWKSKASIEAAQGLRRRMTPSEAVLWEAVRSRGLDGKKFHRQHPIEGFVVDFCCVEERLVVEIDGGIHQRSVASDKEREKALRAAGYRVLRLKNSEVERDIQGALVRIQKHFQPSPPAPLPRAGEG